MGALGSEGGVKTFLTIVSQFGVIAWTVHTAVVCGPGHRFGGVCIYAHTDVCIHLSHELGGLPGSYGRHGGVFEREISRASFGTGIE